MRAKISAPILTSLTAFLLASAGGVALAAEPWAVQHPGVPDPSKAATSGGAKPAPAKAASSTPAPANPAAATQTPTKPATNPAPAAQTKADSTATEATKVDGKGEVKLGTTIPTNGFHKGAPTLVLVDMSSHTTFVLQKQSAGKVVKVYSASDSVGSDKTPTPPGPYWVTVKLKYPCWLPPKDIDPKQKTVKPYNVDHKNPLGVARIGLNKWGINLHGTNQPGSIRKSVSHGCIRHSNHDIMMLYSMVELGTPVIIAEQFAGTELGASSFDKHGSHSGGHSGNHVSTHHQKSHKHK